MVCGSDRSNRSLDDLSHGKGGERLERISWPDVYPRVSARRAWVATAVFTTIAFIVPIAVPSFGARLWPAPLETDRQSPTSLVLDQLPTELQRQIIEAITAIAKGEVSADDALASLSQSSAFNRLETGVQQQVADLFAAAQMAGSQGVFASAKAGEAVSAAAARWAKENTEMERAGRTAAQSESDDASGPESQPPNPDEYTEDGVAEAVGAASDIQTSMRVRTKPDGYRHDDPGDADERCRRCVRRGGYEPWRQARHRPIRVERAERFRGRLQK